MENKYPRIQQWFDDLEQLWTDIEIQPGIDQVYIDLVSECRKFLIKERQRENKILHKISLFF